MQIELRSRPLPGKVYFTKKRCKQCAGLQRFLIIRGHHPKITSTLIAEPVGGIGPIKPLLVQTGIIDQSFDFFFTTISVRGLVATLNFLMWFGNTTILLMAGIQAIDESLFESARLDGASSTRVFFNITMPLLKPIFVYTFITSMIGGLQMFDVPSVLTNAKGTPNRTVMTVIMYLNNYLGGSNNYGMAGAISVILFIVTAILSIIVFKTIDRDKG